MNENDVCQPGCRYCGTTCPRCGDDFPQNDGRHYPQALSRYDNATEVCSRCGMEEAVLDVLSRGYRDGNPVLHPEHGMMVWAVCRKPQGKYAAKMSTAAKVTP